ncbi:ActS/PrrB/RegB family redox-sensitive histidine kinase [Sandaracinobacter sp. RS1-74]|uniref:ActS/PrrB/RegB family redox-sensitive histidine kinase n=1 Tax=Sandaracinobacteroides sayramensis TaxID=2913411 RepID=UPI001EDA53F4|nr:ActS/PrrB/RegB family redox-sensitive histidine kinase [Sandaracinobacteroides sayramensis]MCG2842704.1 ActS/PrrB/RegB family redox-sensitive histidine kinase [Sandaracinobacteroides sayramensis]
MRPALPLAHPGVRVQTLVLLRWMAIAGQLLALFLVGVALGFPIPWVPALAAIAASAALNLWLGWFYRRHDRIGGRVASLQLGFDLAQLSVLLFLTGGLTNPFALLLLVPVTISATLLSARETIALLLMALLLLVGLWFRHLPLPWAAGQMVELPAIYKLGVLVSVGLGMLFLSFYVWQVSAEGRRWQAALVATQTALDREARMGALGSLAAAAAHELGGPLGTITLIAGDLERTLGDDPEFGEDIHLLRQEARRCRDILTGISERAEAEDPFPELQLPALLREVVESHEPARVPVDCRFPWAPGSAPVVRRSPEVRHGLSNIVGNALRHAASRVTVEAGETSGELWVVVRDDGSGFPPDLLPKLGEPFLGPSVSGSGSTGLGIFIATTLLERTGGRLGFGNAPEGGGRVELRWNRADIEAGRETAPQTGTA